MSFRYPLKTVRITQSFGGNAKFYARYGQKGHNGIDLGVKSGTPVYAADEGTVKFEGWGKNNSWMGVPAGICVLINHGGSYAGYAHLSRSVVNKGQRVKKGTLIGYSGATGAATGPHLHFEMLPLKPNFKNGYAGRINPMPYIEKPKPKPAPKQVPKLIPAPKPKPVVKPVPVEPTPNPVKVAYTKTVITKVRNIPMSVPKPSKVSKDQWLQVVKAGLYVGVSAVLAFFITTLTNQPDLFGLFTPVVNVVLVTVKKVFSEV